MFTSQAAATTITLLQPLLLQEQIFASQWTLVCVLYQKMLIHDYKNAPIENEMTTHFCREHQACLFMYVNRYSWTVFFTELSVF